MLEENILTKEQHKELYRQYAMTQVDVILPEVHISIEQSGENNTNVHMDTSYEGFNYHLESIKKEDAEDFHSYLNSQPLVRAKYASGATVTFEVTEKRTLQFNDRFNHDNTEGLYLYSGFIVSDTDTNDFLGIANLGGSGKNDGHAEMAFLNRPDSWSSATPEIIREYAVPEKDKLKHPYKGVGTVEVCSLLQYASLLKQQGYKIQNKELKGVTATARLDNPGSWKSCAKSGMELIDIDINPEYGQNLRYQLKKTI
jgi:hypothetical protein